MDNTKCVGRCSICGGVVHRDAANNVVNCIRCGAKKYDEHNDLPIIRMIKKNVLFLNVNQALEPSVWIG